MTTEQHEATIDDLYQVEGKAELVDGQIVMMSPSGDRHNRAAGASYLRLRLHEQQIEGRAYSDNAGFTTDLPHRKSFSPDVAFHTGAPTGMKFLDSAPVFAVEIRSENDYGPAAEKRVVTKRQDYFDSGTLVVWDVDLLADDVVKSYRSDSPGRPDIFRRGDMASAEPAVPGWSMPVGELFD